MSARRTTQRLEPRVPRLLPESEASRLQPHGARVSASPSVAWRVPARAADDTTAWSRVSYRRLAAFEAWSPHAVVAAGRVRGVAASGCVARDCCRRRQHSAGTSASAVDMTAWSHDSQWL